MTIAKYVVGSIMVLFAILIMLASGKEYPVLFIIIPIVIFFIVKAVRTPGPMKGLDMNEESILEGPDHAGSCASPCHWGVSISESDDEIFGV